MLRIALKRLARSSWRCALLWAFGAALGCSGPDEVGLGQDPAAALRDEAGFIEIEPVNYALVADLGRVEMTSSGGRLWYAFQPADKNPEDKPLAILFNGGPGASTGILYGFNTAKRSFDPAWNGGGAVGPSPASFTAFANLLYVDARATGFSYGLTAGADDPAVRAGEFTVRNFNPFVDAADFARVLLRFLAAHPALRANEVIVVGESYGGIRASILLDMLLRHERYKDGSAGYEDAALASEIEAHLGEVMGAGMGDGPAEAAALQFSRQVLIQPRISSEPQEAAAGAMLEAPGSPLELIGNETGVLYVPCAEKPAPCDPYKNATVYLALVQRDLYDARLPAGSTLGELASIGPRFAALDTLSAALGVDPTTIAHLFATSRGGAYRTITEEPAVEPLSSAFGLLNPWDRYHLLEAYNLVLPAFSGDEAKALSIDRRSPRWGALFLSNLLSVRTFVTNAPNDIAIYTPAFAAALEAQSDEVLEASIDASPDGTSERPGRLRVRFQGGAERTVRFPRYDTSGHVVTLDQPVELAADIEAWLAEE
jgi:hypothetical protein